MSASTRRRRSGFTLIELIVVIAIIMALAALLLAVGPRLMGLSKDTVTTGRMSQIQVALQQAEPGAQGRTAAAFAAVTGEALRFDSLRNVIATITGRDGVNLRSTGEPASRYLPPNLGNRWELIPDIDKWVDPQPSLENVITFLDRQISAGPDPKPLLGEDIGNGYRRHDFYVTVGMRGVRIEGKDEKVERWNPYDASRSRLGETLDRTLEALPPPAPEGEERKRKRSWYLERWPNLVELQKKDDKGQFIVEQSAWALSDWDQDEPGTVPVIWAWPWGERIISRVRGTQIDQVEPHTLADLSPLATLRLLQLAGFVTADDAGAARWRDSTSSAEPWSDRWGHPLVVVAAAMQAPRYDFEVNDTYAHLPSGTEQPKDSSTLLGGRDYLLARAKDTYGHTQMVYVAVGAIGPHLREALARPWEAAADARTLRRLWLQIREVCKAEEWTASSFANPPWKDVRVGRQGRERCLLSKPDTIR